MTHAINSDTNLLSTNITRTHTQMRKSAGRKGGKTERKKDRNTRKEKKLKRKKERRKINK